MQFTILNWPQKFLWLWDKRGQIVQQVTKGEARGIGIQVKKEEDNKQAVCSFLHQKRKWIVWWFCLFIYLFKAGISTEKVVYLKRSYTKRNIERKKVWPPDHYYPFPTPQLLSWNCSHICQNVQLKSITGIVIPILLPISGLPTTKKKLTGLEDFSLFSFVLLGCRQNNVNILPGQVENFVLGGLGAPDPRSSQRPDSGQIHANLTFRGASLEWLCLLRPWCFVSIARCLGLRRVCS